MKTITKLWILISILAVLSPLGLIIPAHFKAGTAWGEWSANEIKRLTGYIPQGMDKLSALWKAPMAGAPCVLSAVAGILIIAGIAYLIGKFLARRPQ